jgi:hypothetical protein
MAVAPSDQLKDLLDAPIFVTVATIEPDGSPHPSPVRAKNEGAQELIDELVLKYTGEEVRGIQPGVGQGKPADGRRQHLSRLRTCPRALSRPGNVTNRSRGP